MAKKSGGRRGGQPPIKGFRPGKAPAQLKKRQAKAQLGSDATWAQKQTVEAVAGKTPQEVRAMVRKWSMSLGIAGAALAVLGGFLYGWAVWAGVVVHVLAAGVLFLARRVRKQSTGLEQIAESLR
jgi:hypothetical protein